MLPKPRVFLSYSSIDKKLVHSLEQTLRPLQVGIWRDRNELLVGDNVQESIKEVIENKIDILLVCVTENSIKSSWVKKEQKLAERATSAGIPIDIIYIKLKEFIDVPRFITENLYIDLSDEKKYSEEILKLAGFLIRYSPFRCSGVYDLYSSYTDLDTRRENAQGIAPCPVDEFIACASKSVVGVGYWFKTLFGATGGESIKSFLKSSSDSTVDLYVPDPDTEAVQHLAEIHSSETDPFIKKVRAFINEFPSYGKSLNLTKDQAKRFSLNLINKPPTHSILSTDYLEPHGRIVADLYAFGIGASQQMKVELRYPKTPLYKTYCNSLQLLTSAENVTKTISADWKK